jgi:hypothetical protein
MVHREQIGLDNEKIGSALHWQEARPWYIDREGLLEASDTCSCCRLQLKNANATSYLIHEKKSEGK